MVTKLTCVCLASLMIVLLAPLRDALAETNENEQRLLDKRRNFPANSFAVMETQLFEGDSKSPKICRTMDVTLMSNQGRSTSFLTQDLYLFDRANNKFGGGALLPPGTYTVVQLTCDSHRYRGSFARFTLQAAQSLNLGCLIVEYRTSGFTKFLYPTYSGRSQVMDLSPDAVASLAKRVPVLFAGVVKRYMTPIMTSSNPRATQ